MVSPNISDRERFCRTFAALLILHMTYLFFSILASVLLLVNFRLHARFSIRTFQAIVWNYPFCWLIGFAMMPAGQSLGMDPGEVWTWFAWILGIVFIITFVASGAATQRMGMTVTSLANNVSLVIPVLFSLFVFKGGTRAFDGWNYLGLVLALGAVVLSSVKKEEANTSQTGGGWGLVVSVFLLYGFSNAAINYLTLRYIPEPERTIPVTLVMLFGAMVTGILLLGYRVWKGQEILAWRHVVAGLALGVPNFFSFYWLLRALNSFGGQGALVYPMYNIGVILGTALVGLVFFREKLTRWNQWGVGLALLALILISYQAIFLG